MGKESNKVNWTVAQEEALNGTGALLVSASAGSGKTTVMIERIMRYLKNGGRLRSLLVLTFSRASAADMKEKLVEKLYAAIRLGDEHSEHLKKELKDLPYALICTIDSFCYEIYNRYFERIGGEAGVGILESEEADLMFLECCKDEAEKALATHDEDFAELYKRFRSNRKYDSYYNAMKGVRDFLAVRDNPEEFLQNALAISAMQPEERPAMKYLFGSYRKKVRRYEQMLNKVSMELASAGMYNMLTSSAQGIVEAYKQFLDALARTNTNKEFLIYLKNNIPSGSFNKSKKGDDEPQFKLWEEELQKTLKAAREYCRNDVYEKLLKNCSTGEEVYNGLISSEKEATKYDNEFLIMFKRSYDSYKALKKEKGKADFADMEQWALKILQKEDVRAELATQIESIFLDEYQDTNYLQETIISLIAQDNTFMVGDVKQSIYMFRHAEPKLFTDRYEKYKSGERKGTNVLLNDNFRSAKGVLDFVNLVFANVMTYDFGGVDYRQTAMLTTKVDFPSDPLLRPVTVAEFADEKEAEKEIPQNYSVTQGAKKSKDYGSEAKYVAATIRSLVGQRKIFDKHVKDVSGKEVGGMRLIKYKDIAVLVRNRNHAIPFIKALMDAGIPYAAGGFDDGDNSDIALLNALLKVLDNMRQDIPLAAVMCSAIGGFSENKMAELRKGYHEPRSFYWQAVMEMAKTDAEAAEFVQKIRKWSTLSHTMGVAELLSLVIAETGFDAYLISTGKPERITAVNTFIGSLRGKEFARSIDKYLEYIKGGGKVTAMLPPSGDDAVIFNTMHGSKGLEYPIVFVVNLSYNKNQDRRTLFADDALGLSLGLSDISEADEDEEGAVTSAKNAPSIMAHRAKRKEEELLEETRLLYVAFTRAKYHLYVSYTGMKKNVADYPDEVKKDAEWLKQISLREDEDGERMKKYYIEPSKPEETEKEEEAQGVLPQGFALDVPFKYKYSAAVETGNKLSVSAINRQEYENEDGSRIFTGLGPTNAKNGTLYHQILEKIDFSVSNFEEFTNNVQKLIKNGDLPEETALIDLSVFKSAPTSYVFQTARCSGVLREQPFMLYLPAKEIGAGECEDKVLLQGVIDLLIMGKKNILVDYKFSRADAETVKKRYSLQLDAYALAVEKLYKIPVQEKIIYIVNQGVCIKL